MTILHCNRQFANMIRTLDSLFATEMHALFSQTQILLLPLVT